ncbi:glycosyltransferase family 2 protein [Acidothermaceae bacterium B102]|nr:glycosyltransferase family 2 protein [Acidothermaceae bacterium B102]
MKLSILMPVYNESATLLQVVKRVLDVDYSCEIELVAVDDGSADNSLALLEGVGDSRLRVIAHERNKGKGAAIRTASEAATGDYMIICDADLEYRPEEIPSLLQPVFSGDATVVYGTRSFGSHNAYSYWYVQGNRGVTLAANLLFNCYISDLETCFKLMPTALYRSLDIQAAGFGMEAQVTARLLKSGVRPYEVPISYRARSRAEGKKLTWRDGVEALWILARERVLYKPVS